MKLLEALIIALLIGALYLVVRDDAAQRGAVPALVARAVAQAHKQDADAASAAQDHCAAELQSSLKAGEAIARLSAPHPPSDPKVQPMFSAADIAEAIQ